MKLLYLVGNILDRICVVLGAFLGSQIPTFIQQYTQRLAGHVTELDHLLNQLRQVAHYSNKTLDQYINKFMTSSDADFLHQGEFMQSMVTRSQDLTQALQHLTTSSLFARPYVFIKELHYEIARSTFASFQIGINLTVEGLCYTGLGVLFGWIIYQTAAKFIQLSFSYARTVARQSV